MPTQSTHGRIDEENVGDEIEVGEHIHCLSLVEFHILRIIKINTEIIASSRLIFDTNETSYFWGKKGTEAADAAVEFEEGDLGIEGQSG